MPKNGKLVERAVAELYRYEQRHPGMAYRLRDVAMRHLAELGLVEVYRPTQWGGDKFGPQREAYRLTAAGRALGAELDRAWQARHLEMLRA